MNIPLIWDYIFLKFPWSSDWTSCSLIKREDIDILFLFVFLCEYFFEKVTSSLQIQHKFYKHVNKWNMTTTNIKKQTIYW